MVVRQRIRLAVMQSIVSAGCCKTMRPKKSRRRGCGTDDEHRQWINNEVSGLITGSITWGVALSGAYGVYVSRSSAARARGAAAAQCVCVQLRSRERARRGARWTRERARRRVWSGRRRRREARERASTLLCRLGCRQLARRERACARLRWGLRAPVGRPRPRCRQTAQAKPRRERGFACAAACAWRRTAADASLYGLTRAHRAHFTLLHPLTHSLTHSLRLNHSLTRPPTHPRSTPRSRASSSRGWAGPWRASCTAASLAPSRRSRC